MAKIIEIQEQTILVKDGLKTTPILKSAFTFEPMIGDEVNIYQSGANIAVLKVDPSVTNDKKFSRKEIMTQLFPKTAFVTKWKYCILAFFVGGWGIHKFYAGKWGQGILYILLSSLGISGILATIDMVIALFKRTNDEKKIAV